MYVACETTEVTVVDVAADTDVMNPSSDLSGQKKRVWVKILCVGTPLLFSIS